MIETKDLIEYIENNIRYRYPIHFDTEYAREIIKRLRELDELKSGQ